MSSLNSSATSLDGLRTDKYPPIDAFSSGHLRVSDIHSIYYEQSGNQKGLPVLYLHGGPGGGTAPSDREYFDPAVYRIILIDQRGSGKSTPPAELRENTTWDLVADIEAVRTHLGIESFVVFGGSWGSTLSLAYAIKHPDRVRALILRGIFLLRKSEIQWFYQDGASHIFPDAWDKYLDAVPIDQRQDLVTAYHAMLTSSDNVVRRRAAKAWSGWEMRTSRLHVDEVLVRKAEEDGDGVIWAEQFARIEAHYFINNGFFESDGWLLDNVDRIRHIPAVIVQGRYDVVCPATSAYELHKAYGPNSELHIVHDAGHSAREEGIAKLLVAASERFKSLAV